MEFSATLYMNTRDVTPWVRSFHPVQSPNTPNRGIEVTFTGWHEIEAGARWDLYASYSHATPRSELILRGGVIPPDQRFKIELARGQNVPFAVTIVDWAWLTQRRATRDTIVLTPSMSALPRVLASAEGPIGRYTVIVAPTYSAAAVSLAALAGVSLEWRLPDLAFGGLVCDPEASLWTVISNLVDPFAPRIYFRSHTNRVLLADRTSQELGIGSRLHFDATSIKSLEISGTPWRRLRRVLIAVPPWH